jgi:hypothetical protein
VSDSPKRTLPLAQAALGQGCHGSRLPLAKATFGYACVGACRCLATAPIALTASARPVLAALRISVAHGCPSARRECVRSRNTRRLGDEVSLCGLNDDDVVLLPLHSAEALWSLSCCC